MNIQRFPLVLGGVVVAGYLVAQPQPPKITVVNMIPNTASNETFQDSEPTLAIHPTDASKVAAATITNNPAFGVLAPIYVSTDGGMNWATISVVPSAAGAPYSFVDPALSMSVSGVVYASLLRAVAVGPSNRPVSILKKTAFADAATPMTEVGGGRQSVDQPFVQTITIDSGGPKDLIFVGSDDYNIDPKGRGRTATVDQYLNDTQRFKPTLVESRPTENRDGAPVRVAAHRDRVYAAFLARRRLSSASEPCSGSFRSDVVVVADNTTGYRGAHVFGIERAGAAAWRWRGRKESG